MKVLKLPNYRRHYLCWAAAFVNVFWDKIKDPREEEWRVFQNIRVHPLYYMNTGLIVKELERFGAKDIKVFWEIFPKDPEEMVRIFKKMGLDYVRIFKEEPTPENFPRRKKEILEKRPIEEYKDILYEYEFKMIEDKITKRRLTDEELKEFIEKDYIAFTDIKTEDEIDMAIIHGFDGEEFYLYLPSHIPRMTKSVMELVPKNFPVIVFRP